MRSSLRNIVILLGLAVCCAALWMIVSALSKAGVLP